MPPCGADFPVTLLRWRIQPNKMPRMKALPKVSKSGNRRASLPLEAARVLVRNKHIRHLCNSEVQTARGKHPRGQGPEIARTEDEKSAPTGFSIRFGVLQTTLPSLLLQNIHVRDTVRVEEGGRVA